MGEAFLNKRKKRIHSFCHVLYKFYPLGIIGKVPRVMSFLRAPGIFCTEKKNNAGYKILKHLIKCL